MPHRTLDSALRRAARSAVLAPSVHNTQPWRLVLSSGALEVHADWARRLPVLDQRGRQLVLSCGCALLNARVALAANGHAVEVHRFPDPSRPGLLARLVPAPDGVPDPDLAVLEPAVAGRRTTRGVFEPTPVPAAVLAGLVVAARAEGADLVPLRTEQELRTAASLSRRADVLEDESPGYRQELRVWTSGDPARTDGVPGPEEQDEPGHVGAPDSRGMGWRAAWESGEARCWAVLTTRHDTQAEWLRAGEALERVLLGATLAGLAASTVMQVVEVAETHDRLRVELDLAAQPQVLLRLGWSAPAPAPAAATRRRRLVDVLSEVP